MSHDDPWFYFLLNLNDPNFVSYSLPFLMSIFLFLLLNSDPSLLIFFYILSSDVMIMKNISACHLTPSTWHEVKEVSCSFWNHSILIGTGIFELGKKLLWMSIKVQLLLFFFLLTITNHDFECCAKCSMFIIVRYRHVSSVSC